MFCLDCLRSTPSGSSRLRATVFQRRSKSLLGALIKGRIHVLGYVAAVVSALMVGGVAAIDYRHGYDQRIKAELAVAPIDPDTAVGANVSLLDGALSFRHVDVSIPGIEGLPVEIVRRWDPDEGARFSIKAFEDWDLEVPHIAAIVSRTYGWNFHPTKTVLPLDGTLPGIDDDSRASALQRQMTGDRCSRGRARTLDGSPDFDRIMPPMFEVAYYRERSGALGGVDFDYKQYVPTSRYWRGYEMQALRGEKANLLVRDMADTRFPESVVWVAEGGWILSCIPERTGLGEGFLAKSPTGLRYRFDTLVYRNHGNTTVPAASVSDFIRNRHFDDFEPRIRDGVHVNFSDSAVMRRSEAMLYASRVEDRFGNWLEYDFDRGKVVAIRSSDGRRVDLQYNARGAIVSVSAAGREWRYEYSVVAGLSRHDANLATNDRVLASVVQPDATRWIFDLALALDARTQYRLNDDASGRPYRFCLPYGPEPPLFTMLGSHDRFHSSILARVIAPTGLETRFILEARRHPLGAADGLPNHESCSVEGNPRFSANPTVVHMELRGAGFTSISRRYTFPSEGATFFWECMQLGNSCPDSKVVIVEHDDGRVEHHRIGIRMDRNLGFTLGLEIRQGNAVLPVSRKEYEYTTPETAATARWGQSPIFVRDDKQAYWNQIPFTTYWYDNSRSLTGQVLPIVREITTLDSEVFVRVFSGFDHFGRPGSTLEEGPSGSRAWRVSFFDSSTHWVLGQTARTMLDGIETSRTEFNALAQPVRRYVFGALQHLLGYHADGSVRAVTDARGHTTTLGDWFRGVPRRIGHPDGTTQSATVSNEGWLTSVTDQNGFTTSYGYDALGRLLGIAYPTGDPVAYAGTWIQYKPLDAATDWLPPGTLPGMWRRLEGRGNFIRATYYDALLRPVLDLQYDQASVGETLRSTRTAYDAAGRVAFQSMPIAGAESSTTGTRTEYDALGRVTRVTQDSEHGPLLTTIEYLPGLRTRVTRPKGAQTTTSYLAFGVPSTDWPVVIHEPEGRITEITRDVFGKPTLIRRRNADGSIQLDRRYVYDDQQRLCKQLDPETGATVTDYDANGNVAWRVSGSPLTANPWCDRGDQPAGDVTRFSYDALNRVVREDRPGSDADLHTEYTPDGLVRRRSAGDHHWYYEYNRLRLPTRERLEHLFQGMVFPYQIDWRYDALGHRSGMVIGSTEVDYSPNALGQPTRVGGFASGALYHPDGALRSVTLGNGITRTFTQNARGLPERIRDAGGQVVLDETVRYDAHGNPVQQLDHLGAAPGARRDLRYDALDRLTYSHVHGLHIETFQYDVLDNIRRRDFFDGVTTRTDTYNYDGFNRLQSISSLNGVQAFGHDPRGNISTRLNLGHAYNSANQLVSISSGHRFEYDGHGRRTVSWRPGGGGKMDVYDAGGVLRYTSDSRWSGAVTYLHLGRTLVAERFLRWDGTGEELRYVHTDVLGSPVLRTDRWGNVVERERFTAYGEPTDGSVREALGFTGHMEDPALGLTYMQQRYYDPAIGRFLSVDPVGPLADPLQHFGRYHYANNNPYRYTDPDGRNPLAGAAIGAGLDFVIQVAEIGMGSRTEIDGGSILVSAGSGALGVGLAGKAGKLGELLVDAAISAGSTAAKGEEVTALGVAADVGLGKAGSAAAAKSITETAAHKTAQRQADRLERVGNKPGARTAQQERAKAAGPALQQSVAQKSAQAGVVASGVGSAGVRQVERKPDEKRP
ncbi:RHS repeat-associated core domain-containing protein [Silanimonas sp.]|uniref:RHS repeat domain-containing protein n=1 Tax=Silanimonas sp. TaxID=1929290 RepID=UPI001BC3E4C5|nr:RHS repeat-associated core domain-containing protein [Silanimonas sp.]MBS3896461.1 RHS repeat-associated core domain-containing protein [Silanimonas sp.]MBS3924455.1 RHS repeat-associated core domain-containing protein [Xanthomonadaceae bacterium]